MRSYKLKVDKFFPTDKDTVNYNRYLEATH